MQRVTRCTWTVFAAFVFALVFILLTAPEARSAATITDNSTSGRFSASSDWIKSNYSPQRYGANYRVLKRSSSAAGPARWKVDVPACGSYDVFARWPSDPGYTGRATFKVSAVDGVKTKVVNQRQNGGRWIKLGTYKMAGGDGWKVSLASRSTSKGFIVADAVKIAKPSTTTTNSGGGATGADVIRVARNQLGEPYVYGANGPSSFDCSGFTQYVYKQAAGISLPHNAAMQSKEGRSVSRSELKPGDLIFGNAGGSGVQHVGIYEIYNGKGYMIHAGTEQTDVERTPFPNSWYNVLGYRRLI